MNKPTGNIWVRLSDTKKGIAALVAAVLVGFAIGTMTVAQVGLPKRVDALELTVPSIATRVSVLEGDRIDARLERDYIIRVLNWQSCAIEATSDDTNIRDTCGNPPQYTFRRD